MRKYLGAFGSGFLLAVVLGNLVFVHNEVRAFDPEAALQQLEGVGIDTHDALERNISKLIEAGGIEGALSVIELAFGREEIFMNDCHSLFHLTGHFAPEYFNDDFDALVQLASLKCARGYLHGAEAQITIEGYDVPLRLRKLCEALREKEPGHDCMHGVGHALLNMSLDAQKSLDECNALGATIGEPLIRENDLAACHEAVFSEITNISGGYDGETGRHYQGEPPIFITTSPLEYCASFATRYHRPCGLEFSAQSVGQQMPPQEVGKLMKQCLTDAVSRDLATACFYNIASMYVRHEIAERDSITFQRWVLDESKDTRLWYILAVGHEIAEHLNSGHFVDSDAFCDNFTESDEVAICKEQVHNTMFVIKPPA